MLATKLTGQNLTVFQLTKHGQIIFGKLVFPMAQWIDMGDEHSDYDGVGFENIRVDISNIQVQEHHSSLMLGFVYTQIHRRSGDLLSGYHHANIFSVTKNGLALIADVKKQLKPHEWSPDQSKEKLHDECIAQTAKQALQEAFGKALTHMQVRGKVIKFPPIELTDEQREKYERSKAYWEARKRQNQQ
jgi:hypothetical protein